MKLLKFGLLLSLFFNQPFIAQNKAFSKLYFDRSKDIKNYKEYQLLNWSFGSKVVKTTSPGEFKILPDLFTPPLLSEKNYKNNKDFLIQNIWQSEIFCNSCIAVPVDKISQQRITVELFRFGWK